MFRTFEAAKAWRTDAAKAARAGLLSTESKHTVRDAGEQLIGNLDSNAAMTRSGSRYKPSVARAYKRNLHKYVYPALGSTRLTNLRRRDVQRFVNELVASGLTGSTVRNILAPLRVICRRAIENDEITVNPTAHLRLPEGPGRRERVATATEAMTLLDALPAGQQSLWAAAFFSGLRRGELRALRWSDIDNDTSIIRVCRTWDDVVGEVDPKSRKSNRTVPVATILRRFLLGHKTSTGRADDDLVFGTTAEKPFSPTVVNTRARAAWATRYACGCTRPIDVKTGDQAPPARCPTHHTDPLRPICLHECRHTYVSLMHDAGLSLERIGDYVGHNSTYMVDRYRHLLEGHETEAARLFDQYLLRHTRTN